MKSSNPVSQASVTPTSTGLFHVSLRDREDRDNDVPILATSAIGDSNRFRRFRYRIMEVFDLRRLSPR